MAAEESPQNRRALVVGGAFLGAIALFFVATQLFGGGGGGSDRASGASGASGTTAPPAGVAQVGGLDDPLLARAVGESFEVFTIRDPFRPLITTAEPGGEPAPGGGVTTPTTGSGTGATGSTGSGATGGTGVAPPVPAGSQVALLDVFVDAGVTKARVRVDETIYTVREGDAFAVNFFVVTLTDACGEFLHADVRFSLCEGQQTIT